MNRHQFNALVALHLATINLIMVLFLSSQYPESNIARVFIFLLIASGITAVISLELEKATKQP